LRLTRRENECAQSASVSVSDRLALVCAVAPVGSKKIHATVGKLSCKAALQVAIFLTRSAAVAFVSIRAWTATIRYSPCCIVTRFSIFSIPACALRKARIARRIRGCALSPINRLLISTTRPDATTISSVPMAILPSAS
jgi:hypothetical protein